MPKSVRQLLDDAEADILMRMDPVRKELNILERELADVRKAKNAINSEGSPSTVVRIVGVGDMRRTTLVQNFGGGEARELAPPPSPYAKLTMKQLVRKALDEHFTNGATANELLDFFRNAWGRHDIVRTSLSPQLSRLKQDGVVTLKGMRWHLVGMVPADPDENGAPAALPLDAPEAGEVAASPNESQSTLRWTG
jgi:hypothetical protein